MIARIESSTTVGIEILAVDCKRVHSRLLILLTGLIDPAYGQGLVNGPVEPHEGVRWDTALLTHRYHSPRENDVRKRLSRSVLASPRVNEPDIVNFTIGRDGMVRPGEIFVRCFSTDHDGKAFPTKLSLLDDFACFDAIMSNVPFKSPLPTAAAQGCQFSFFAQSPGVFSEISVIKSNKILHGPSSPNPVIRLIPLSIAWRYPTAYSENELNSRENLRALKKDVFDWQYVSIGSIQFERLVRDKRLIRRYILWSRFLVDHKHATRQSIDAHLKKIDSECGAIFED